MLRYHLVYSGVFRPAQVQTLLAQIAPTLGGDAPPTPPPLQESRPDLNGQGRCGVWSSRENGTTLQTVIESGEGNPREGFPYEQRHSLTTATAQVSVEGTTLMPELYDADFAITGASPQQVLEIRRRLGKALRGTARESTSTYYRERLCHALIEGGAPELARPLLEETVAAAQAEGATAASTRLLYALAAEHGVSAPAPVSAADEPLPPIDNESMASVVVLVGNLARLRRYITGGLDDAQKGWLLASAIREKKPGLAELLVTEGALPAAVIEEGIGRAVAADDAATLRLLLTARTPTDAALTDLLVQAALFSGPDVIDALIGSGADANAVLPHARERTNRPPWKGLRHDGHTPLLAAVHGARAENVAALLAAGADPNRLTRAFRMPLDAALTLEKPGDVEAVLRAGGARLRTNADLDLAGAVYVGDDALAAERGVDASPDDRRRAFLCAVRAGRAPYVEELAPDDRETLIEAANIAVAEARPAAMAGLAPRLARAPLDDRPAVLLRVPVESFSTLRGKRRLRRLVDVASGDKPVESLGLPADQTPFESIEFGPGFGYLDTLLRAPSRERERFRHDLFQYYAHPIAHPELDAIYWQPEHILWTLGMWAQAARAMCDDLGLPRPFAQVSESFTYRSRGQVEHAQSQLLVPVVLAQTSPFIGEWLALTAEDPELGRTVGSVADRLLTILTHCLGRAVELDHEPQALVMIR